MSAAGTRGTHDERRTMTNELIALVAILANDALPPESIGSTVQLDYGCDAESKAAYRRAVDALDAAGLVTPNNVRKHDTPLGPYEVIEVGGFHVTSPVNLTPACDDWQQADEQAPIVRLANETVRHLTLAPAFPAFYSGDPGDEHDGPEAA